MNSTSSGSAAAFYSEGMVALADPPAATAMAGSAPGLDYLAYSGIGGSKVRI